MRTLKAAVAEALFLIGLERNADVVVASSFAPLLKNVNGNASRPCCGNQHNLVQFNATHLFATPSFYAQRMLSESLGTHALPTSVSGGATAQGALWSAQASTSTSINASRSASSSSSLSSSSDFNVVVKLVNYQPAAQPVNITLDGLHPAQKVTAVSAQVLTDADPLAENTLDQPLRVEPKAMMGEDNGRGGGGGGGGFVISGREGVHGVLPAWSVVVATLTIE